VTRGVGESVSKRSETFVRIAGLIVAIGAIGAATYVIAKLYTGRGAATPIRAAIYEQPLVALLGLAGVAVGIWMAVQPRQAIAARAWLNPRWVWRERRGEAILLLISGLLGIAVLEAGSRALYARDERLPFFFPPEFLVYPPLYHAMQDYAPDATNVLLLGGSVLNGAGRDGKLQDALGPGWRVYNVAQNAHSSLDSLTKYRWLIDRGYRFDYVVFYHGINEVRANNAPPEVFRANYSHYLFYRLVHAVFGGEHPVRRAALHSALVFRADRLVTQLRETRAFGRNFVNIAYPREDWLNYGVDVRSAASFEANLTAIAELANETGAKMIVGEFLYDPRLDDYAEGRAGAGSRDEMVAYTKEWGLPEHVRGGILAHNALLAAHTGEYTYISFDAMKRSENFIDPCHFADGAEAQFVRLWAEALTHEHARTHAER
jgi:hypothetical protein